MARILAAVLALYGAGLLVPGLYLWHLGGSPFYSLTGVTTLACAALLWRNDARVLSLYALMLVATLIWALSESGMNGWALLPRIGWPILLAALLLAVTRTGTVPDRARAARRTISISALVGLVLIAIGLMKQASTTVFAMPSTPAPATAAAAAVPAGAEGDWLEFGRDKAGTRFSPLTQLTPANVGQLELAWSYRVGLPRGMLPTLEATPLKIGERVYFCAANSDVIALDAETGKQAWRFEAKANPEGIFLAACRGVAYFKAEGTAGGGCSERIISSTVDRRLIAVNAVDGTPCRDFGKDGEVSLDRGMGAVEPGYYHVTSAPQVIRGKVVVGGWVTDGQKTGEPSGVIRAYDALTGALAWAWDMGRPDEHGEPAEGSSYTLGTPNSWAPMSADEELGLLYLPIGNATPDYVAQHRRPFDEAYTSSVVALDARTGTVRWSFQTTHHDVWDYDVASQATLIDLADGRKALLQPTKRGEIFLLDRVTGAPLSRVEERAVPKTTVPGEFSAPTQPFSVDIPSFAGTEPSEARMWGITPFDQLWCRIKFREARYEGTLTPVGLDKPSVIYPGYIGGIDWGSVAVDTDRQIVIVNSVEMVNYDQLITRAAADSMGLRPVSTSYHSDVGRAVAQAGTPYAAVISPFLSPLTVPCAQPPYGNLSAFDLRTKKMLWQKPFGTARRAGPMMMHSHLPFTMGVPNAAGSIVTRSGLIFIGASQDDYFRAVDSTSGKELWRVSLPAGGQATPLTYWSTKSGRQFVLIAAGGHPALRTTLGDYVQAYALPKR